jgi:type VI secretion system protein VasI
MRRMALAVIGGCLACAALSTTDAAAQQHQWRMIEGTSRIDGTRQVVLFLDAGDEVTTDTVKQARPMLFIRCSENVTSLFVDLSPFYVSGSVPVFWRVDGEMPVSGTWWAVANSGGVGPWRGGQAIRFIKSLVDREKLLLRFTPQEGHPIEAVFNIFDLKASIGPLRAACSW